MEEYIPKSSLQKPVRFISVAAHKDDTEMLAFDGILRSLKGEGGFVAVVLTDGGACPRAEGYESLSDEDMALLRTAEQKRAAEIGGYNALYLLEKSSAEIKRRGADVVAAVAGILARYPGAEVLYTHNPFDRHPTHTAAGLIAIEAVRMLKKEEKPRKIYGCEVWRDLDWTTSRDKIALDVGGAEEFGRALMEPFVSQNAVKRYDLAAAARRTANATFYESHEGDATDALCYAVDMTGLGDEGADLGVFIEGIIGNFTAEVKKNCGLS